jgi:outer membrane receptor protein involved in Fe transport
VAFWIKNLTDEDVWAIGLDVPLIAGYAAFQLPPRTYGATIRVKF